MTRSTSCLGRATRPWLILSLSVLAICTAPALSALAEESHQHTFSTHWHSPKAARLPSTNPTRSFWTHSSPDANPLAREGSEGALTTDADVCVIGSGITGVGIAYHLSEEISGRRNAFVSPLKVVILEARDFCSGATGRNGGHLTPAAYAKFVRREREFGRDEAIRSYALEKHTTTTLVDIIERHEWVDDVDLVEGGHLSLLITEEEERESFADLEAAKQAGMSLEDVEVLSKEEVQSTFGSPYPAIKFPGHNVWPLKLVTKLFQHANESDLDLRLHTHTPVTAIEKVSSTGDASGRSYSLLTPRGSIACSRVVHATNAYASHLLPFMAGPEGIVPTRGQIIATRASVGTGLIKKSSWEGGDSYWFPRPVTQPDEKPLIIIGGQRSASKRSLERYIDDDSTVNPNVGQALRDFLPAVFEGKFEVGKEPEMEWTGIMGYTSMGDPFVGPISDLFGEDDDKYNGQYIAAGYTGHGMPRAFSCAEVIAQMIIADITDVLWTVPEWLPTRYLTGSPERRRY